jgi:hypothetical protein
MPAITSAGGGGGGGVHLGSAQITGGFTTASLTPVQATGLTVTVLVPGGTHIKITFSCQDLTNTLANDNVIATLWDGAVGGGTQLALSNWLPTAISQTAPCTLVWVGTPAAGSKTYNVGLNALVGGTAKIEGSATAPSLLLVESI